MKQTVNAKAWLAVGGSWMALAAAALAQNSALQPEDLKQSCREALGYQALQAGEGAGWIYEGTMKFAELERTATFAFNGKGQWAENVAGNFSTSYGYDGTMTWMRDFTGDIRQLDPADSEPARLAASVLSMSWLSADSPVSVEAVEIERGRGMIQVGVRCNGGTAKGRLTVDAQTYQPTKLTVFFAGDEEFWEFGDYKKMDNGVTAPTYFHYSDFSDNTFTARFSALRPVQAQDGDVCKAPQADPARVTFDGTADPVIHLTRINKKDSRYFTDVMINGKKIGPFIVNFSSPVNTISPAAASAAGLSMEGLFQYRASGDTLPARFRKGQTFQIGAMTLQDPAFIQGDFTFDERVVGQDVAGTLGYNTFAHSVAVFDPAGMTLTLNNPSGYTLPAGGVWQDMRLNHSRPQALCNYEGNHAGYFNVEPAIGSWLEMNGPTVARYNLLGTRETKEGIQATAGAMRKIKIGTLEWIELGGARVDKVQAGFFEGLKGWAGDPFVDGTIGARMLDSYVVVFDYPGRRIAFVKK